MKERPILFAGPMVRAILDGTKTQTRRVVKPWHGAELSSKPVPEDVAYLPDFTCYRSTCPYGQPGDRLWVRESWRVRGGREHEYQQDRSQVMYRATHHEDGFPLTWESYTWRPSIHMPRWASRLTLEVIGVRVERLQEISEADAAAEGLSYDPGEGGAFYVSGLGGCAAGSAVGAFCKLWKSINGPSSWDANPWVWVVEFKRLDTPAA